ncbi:carboxylesterase family protein [Actinoplanes sp. LDG1-06]|uniref:Carboxylic ester hydrolase n=1 Tax=Paractinoplanes ovalisporus TaxID=2810368 RepID=A0ABS2AIE8_9ACTN|nr:carboxylesterase family protein [Actinoplanes ovalisporus]MBM2619585.1 carboxylesterase family protein [Actinoplanes ovalisporus]
MSTSEVAVAAGKLRGRWESGVAVFRGIPYAAPPVGPRRFAAPQPAPGWAGVRPAGSFGPPVPQADMFGGAPDPAAGDDWLTVNVWTPDPGPAARLPVMVWIYGGGYTVGMSSWPEYDGGHLARDGDVVLVTFNYRLGVEGFAAIAGAPANRGLLDQVAALEWVRDNIAAFGGDPARVTVFGESAGAGSVAALLAMPRTAGLFRRAVAQSVAGPFFSRELADDIAAALAAEVGKRPTVDDLSDVDPARLAALDPSRPARWGAAGLRSILFAPVVDGEILPATPWHALAAGAAREVDLLAGHTRDEHRLFALIESPTGTDLGPFVPDDLGRYSAAYPGSDLHEIVHSDWLFRMPSVFLADAHARAGGRTHFYELTWPAPGLGGTLGACHGLDVPLVFGNLTSGRPAMLLGDDPGDDAAALSSQMRAAWTAFATYGDPGWPAYTPDRRLTQIFDVPATVAPYPEQASHQIWQTHPFDPLTLAPDLR